MSSYKSKDFSKMLFPVFELEANVDLLVKFPRLNTIKAFCQSSTSKLDFNRALRYVMFCYDKNSKLLEISDLKSRKEMAAKLAGFGSLNSSVKQMMSNGYAFVNDMIIAYCRLQNNRLFQMKITALEAFYEYQRIIIEPIDSELDDDKIMRAANLKTKLIEDCDLIHEKIKKYNLELFSSEEDAADMDEALAKAAVSPENISKLEL